MQRATMPEAAINEDSNLVTWEKQVWSARKARFRIQPIAKPCGPKRAPQYELRGSPTMANPPH